jgi:hypothetical protein
MGAQPSVEEPGEFDFANASIGNTPNHKMLWPEFDGALPKPNAIVTTAPKFNMSVEALQHAFESMMSKEPKTRIVRRNDAKRQITWEQKTPNREYIDWITVEFVPAGEGASFYAYSRSSFASFDWGTNSRRLNRFVRQVQAEIKSVDSVTIKS